MTRVRDALMWPLSVLFIVQMYLAMAVLGLLAVPFAIVRREAALGAMQLYCAWVRFSARWMLGLHSQVRGPVPQGAVLVAAKHQSFFDIILIFSALPQPRFIMKKELSRAPILGWYALRIGCVPVDRGRRGHAVRQMLADVAAGAAEPGQLIIYPQGTRVAPGAHLPYKTGTGALYAELAQPCVPVATNVGLFWPRRGILRRPGVAVVEFLPAMVPSLPLPQFMADLETAIETASDALMREGGFAGPHEGKATDAVHHDA